MSIVKKSLARKFLLTFLLFALAVGGVGAYYRFALGVDIPWFVYLGVVASFFLFAVLYYYLAIFRPLKKILYQMQSLLAGKGYKKIYCERIDEVGVLAYFFNQVTKGLSEVSYDIKDRARMLDELTIASQLQADTLPAENPSVAGLQIVAKTKPASELGGDSFNMFTKGSKTFIYIGDVTGHGVAAGLIMTMVNSLISVFLDMFDSAFEIVVHVNKYIKKHVKKAMYMTFLMLCWDGKAQRLTYVGAGHEHIIVYRAANGSCEAILSGGVALGMLPDNSKVVSEREIPLQDGDVVVLYTDGITEARDPSGQLYGLEKLKTAVKEFAPQYGADGIHHHIAADVTAFMSDAKQLDDMTLIVLKRDVKNEQLSDRTITWQKD